MLKVIILCEVTVEISAKNPVVFMQYKIVMIVL